MRLLQVKLKMSTSNHPQTDGQTEVMNRMIEDYLRIFCNYRQDNWDAFLSAAEFAYSTSLFPATGLTPFFMDLGWNPKSPLDLLDPLQTTNVQSVDDHRALLSSVFKDAQTSYISARERQRTRLESRFISPTYCVGDQVMLSTASYKDAFSRTRPSLKLLPRFIGPFKILELIGKNAVRLNLPNTMHVHPVINVSHTKPYHDQPDDIRLQTAEPPPPIIGHLGEEYEVDRVLNHRKVRGKYQFLVLWKGHPPHDASWEPLPNFEHEDGTYHSSLHSYLDEAELDDEDVIPQRGE